jgi:N-sulfoglucosamine sulfohydrolase
MRIVKALILCCLFSLGLAAAVPRNVVLVVSDDHGRDTGAYGNPVIRTPHLDRLASEGTLFANAFATTASCSASRSVILTGLHNHRTGQYGHQHDYHHFRSFDHIRSLPVLLSEAGFRTASVGKFHLAPESAYRFDEYIPGAQRNPVEMAENTRRFLEENRDRPFFLYFCPSDPHRGGGVAEEIPERPDRFGNRDDGYPGIEEIRYDPRDVVVPPYLPDNLATRAELAQYYQSVSRLDQGVGRLVALLRELDLIDRTLILYISDHGPAFPGAKTTVYEPGLRSPCIVRSPDAQRRGVVSQALVGWTDLVPTILEFAGVVEPVYEAQIGLQRLRDQVPPMHGLHGRSFLPILEEGNPEGWDEVFASHTFHEIQMYYPMRVIRTRRHKLIWNLAHGLPYPFASDLWASATWQSVLRFGRDARFGLRKVGDYIHRPEFEFYDILEDPWESRNLANDSGHAATLAELKARLRDFQRRTADPWLLKWDYE